MRQNVSVIGLIKKYKLRSLALILTACICLVVGVLFFRDSRSVSGLPYSGVASPSAPAEYRYKRVAYLGDDYTVGVGAEERNGFSYQMNRRFCWSGNNNGQSGTGYLNAGEGEGYSAYPDRVQDVLANAPELILVQGGSADVGIPGVFEAASGLYAELRQRAPDVLLVAVGPIDAPGARHDLVSGVRDEVRAAAEANGVLFIDPIDSDWSVGPDGFDKNGLVPTQATHTNFSDYLVRALKNSGLPDLSSCQPVG